MEPQIHKFCLDKTMILYVDINKGDNTYSRLKFGLVNSIITEVCVVWDKCPFIEFAMPNLNCLWISEIFRTCAAFKTHFSI